MVPQDKRKLAHRQPRNYISRDFEEAPTKDEMNNDGSSESQSPTSDVLDFEGLEPAFRRTTDAIKNSIRIASRTDRPHKKKVHFSYKNEIIPQLADTKREMPGLPAIRHTDGTGSAIVISSESPSPVGVSHEEDLESSETASMSGAGSVYSQASSRTKSTDYGLYYTRRALSQELRSMVTLADPEAMYRKAGDRVFQDFEAAPMKNKRTKNKNSESQIAIGEADDVQIVFEGLDPAFRRTTDTIKSAIRIPSHTDRPQRKKVHFSYENQIIPQLTDKKIERNLPTIHHIDHIITVISSVSPARVSHEVDLENSEIFSMSGTGSVYSHASSRTKSTDYGLYYTRRALLQE